MDKNFNALIKGKSPLKKFPQQPTKTLQKNQQKVEIKKVNVIKEENDVSHKLSQTKLIDRYRACMILSAVGDAMGYKNSDWEFNTSSKLIHQKMLQMTNNKGIKELKIDMSWRYSDDTVMQMATAKGLAQSSKNISSIEKVCQSIAVEYKQCAKRMANRAPGKTCMKSISILQESGKNWNEIPFNKRSVGCGGSMRSACIGLVFWREDQVKQLIAVSIQAGRMTHHNPIGYLGSMVSAFFTSLAIRKVPIHLWVRELFEVGLPLSKEYIIQAKRESDANISSQFWETFVSTWKEYAKDRNLSITKNQSNQPLFPQNYGIEERQRYYRKISFAKWPGASGLDSTIISYDALLGASMFENPYKRWEEFCLRGILHGGDNDSTGAIGGAWFGALYGFQGVYQKNYVQVQDNVKLRRLGQQLLQIASS